MLSDLIPCGAGFALDSFAESDEVSGGAIVSWEELFKRYLTFRDGNYPLVVPSFEEGLAAAVLNKSDGAAFQEAEGWYWHFYNGVALYDDRSDVANQIQPNSRVMIYEDVVHQELRIVLVPAIESEPYRELMVYRAPAWPEPLGTEDVGSYLSREISKRRMVWQVTLKSPSAVEKEYAEARLVQPGPTAKDTGEDGGRMLSGMEEYTHHLWLSIRGPAQGRADIEIGAHFPSGFTNRLEIFSGTNLTSFIWSLAATNLGTEGTDVVHWVDGQTEEADCRFYAAGKGLWLDVDSVEVWLHHVGGGVRDRRLHRLTGYVVDDASEADHEVGGPVHLVQLPGNTLPFDDGSGYG